MAEHSDSTFRASRRQFLGTATASIISLGVLGGQAAAAPDDYGTVVDVVEAGADPTGEESITGVIEDVIDDDTLLVFPEGEYYMDRQVRFTDFENLGLQGNGSTLVPAPADEFSGESRLFKLGTYYAPGQDLTIEDFQVDFRADNTGLRAFQLQIADGLDVRNVEVLGEHDSGTWGPFLFDIVDPDGSGVVQNVSAAEGGAFTEDTAGDGEPTVGTGPTGIIVSPYHKGELTVQDATLGGFPDNGLYSSAPDGTVAVEGGRFENSNVANIRLAGTGTVQDTEIVVDENRSGDMRQPGIRLDGGDHFHVANTSIALAEPNGEAISVTGSADETIIEAVAIRQSASDSTNDAISVSEDAGPTVVRNCAIRTDCPGQALLIEDGDAPVRAESVTITGDASGATGGRHAIRCERDGTEFVDLQVSQSGPGLRRALYIGADDVTVSGGNYHGNYYPIVNNASGTRIESVTAWAEEGREALKLYGGNDAVDLVGCTLYNGITGDGDYVDDGNEFPEGEPDIEINSDLDEVEDLEDIDLGDDSGSSDDEPTDDEPTDDEPTDDEPTDDGSSGDESPSEPSDGDEQTTPGADDDESSTGDDSSGDASDGSGTDVCQLD